MWADQVKEYWRIFLKVFYLLKFFKGGIDSDHLILSTHGHPWLKTSLPCVQWWAIWWMIWQVMTQNCKMFLIKHGWMCANAPIVSTHWRRGPRCQYKPLVAAVEDHHHHHHRHHVDPLQCTGERAKTKLGTSVPVGLHRNKGAGGIKVVQTKVGFCAKKSFDTVAMDCTKLPQNGASTPSS